MPYALHSGMWMMDGWPVFANRLTDAIVGILIIMLILLLYTEMTRPK